MHCTSYTTLNTTNFNSVLLQCVDLTSYEHLTQSYTGWTDKYIAFLMLALFCSYSCFPETQTATSYKFYLSVQDCEKNVPSAPVVPRMKKSQQVAMELSLETVILAQGNEQRKE